MGEIIILEKKEFHRELKTRLREIEREAEQIPILTALHNALPDHKIERQLKEIGKHFNHINIQTVQHVFGNSYDELLPEVWLQLSRETDFLISFVCKDFAFFSRLYTLKLNQFKNVLICIDEAIEAVLTARIKQRRNRQTDIPRLFCNSGIVNINGLLNGQLHGYIKRIRIHKYLNRRNAQ